MLKKLWAFLGRRSPELPASQGPSRLVSTTEPRVVHRPIPTSDLDPDAVKIIQRLTRFDHDAYLVGGCVRDLLLDRHPKDFDIGTSATPRQVRRVFRNCRIIGRRFRLAHIYFHNGKIIEVATFRSRNGDRADAEDSSDLMIRDDNQFGSPEEDALRRDFTINALFYDLNNQNVLDHANGLDDLERRLVRTIGDPTIRFHEDPIRILRAIKFAARLGFDIEPETLKAMRQTCDTLPKAAPPRILEEIHRFGREGAAQRSFQLLRETGIFPVLLPELSAAYEDPHAWALVDHLFADMDRRQASGHHPSLGETLSILLLPLLVDTMGWSRDGTVTPPENLDTRDMVDRQLRPIALRLRISRREQERCRQLIGFLYRMVPVQPLRRGARRSLLRRQHFDEALALLEALGQRWDASFASSATEWRQEREQNPELTRAPGHEATAPPRPRRRRRRRRRRGPRDAAAEPTQNSAAKQPKANSPEAPPWSDDYFFAALPNAPTMGPDDRGDRYGAGQVAAEDGSPGSARQSNPEDEPPATPSRPRRRRRRRRGPRRPGSDGAPEPNRDDDTNNESD